MQLVDELRAQHDLIESVAGALLTYAASPARSRFAADGAALLRFFRLYANQFHHAREEDTLFAALRDRAGLPADRGPIATMVADHRRMAGLLDDMASGLEGGEDADGRFRIAATAYVHALWHHIDAENSVLFPECGPRLRRNGVLELPSRQVAPDERDAMEAGRALVARYPPPASPEVMRGDGCIMCPAFAVTCRGLELEWWNEWEWDEFEDRMNAG
jgi:hemerythrin-like domain-containing protein